MQEPVPDEKTRFHSNLLLITEIFLDVLKRLPAPPVPPAIAEVLLATLKGQSESEKDELIRGYIEHTHVLWPEIRKRNVDQLAVVASRSFRKIPIDLAPVTKVVLQNAREDELGTLWTTADGMVKICIKYVHFGRKPYSRPSGTGYENPDFHSKVDLEGEAKSYKLELPF